MRKHIKQINKWIIEPSQHLIVLKTLGWCATASMNGTCIKHSTYEDVLHVVQTRNY